MLQDSSLTTKLRTKPQACRRKASIACALAVAATAAVVPAASAAPATPASKAGPSLSKAGLKDGVLELTARCDGKATATVRTGQRLLGTLAMSCARGAAVRLRLPRAVAARANRAGGLALEVDVRDQKGSATIPMSFIRPRATRSSGPAARSAAVSYWQGPATNCAKYPYTPGQGTMFIDTYAGGASFGYALGTPLTLGAYTQVWSRQLGWQNFWRGWQQYNALSANATSWGTTLTQVYPGVYARTEIIVRNNGARRWVKIGRADWPITGSDGAQWCYFA